MAAAVFRILETGTKNETANLSALIFAGLNFRKFRGRQIFEHFAGLKFREFREFCEFLLQFRGFKAWAQF